MKTAAWDVVAWSRAAASVLTDYGSLEPVPRNILRLVFCDSSTRTELVDWESEARSAVAAFRSGAARAGACESAQALVDELGRSSPEVAAIRRDHDVRTHGGGTNHLRHPTAGPVTLDHSAFAADSRPDLGLVI